MFRKALIALATTVVVAGASLGAAQAHGSKFFGNGHHHGHHKSFFVKKNVGFGHCKFVKRKIFIGHNKFGRPIYKFKTVKVCF